MTPRAVRRRKARSWKMWAKLQDTAPEGGLFVRVFVENLDFIGHGAPFRVTVTEARGRRK